MNILRANKKQQGMTLIEILIAMVLGSFLLGGVYKIFLGSSQNYRLQENLSRIQESGRFAMEFITREVRMAGFHECYSESSASGSISGTDIVGFAAPLNAGTDSITVTQKTDDCVTADVISTVRFTIQDFNIPLANPPRAEPTLYAIGLGGVGAQPLIEGIEDMQILYGEDTDADGTPDYYVNADGVVGVVGVADVMVNVVSVRISLLVRSLSDRLTSQPLTYTFNGITVTPVDRRLRRVFTSTIGIRNRL